MPAPPGSGTAIDVRGQSRSADAAQIHVDDLVLGRAESARNARRRGELGCMALAVGDAQRMTRETLLTRERQGHCGIHAAGDQDDSFAGCAHGEGENPRQRQKSKAARQTGSFRMNRHSRDRARSGARSRGA